jgi:hypothetical protein
VSTLVRRKLLDIAIEGGIEASFGEVGLREVCEALAVKSIFKMFQCQGIVEYIS